MGAQHFVEQREPYPGGYRVVLNLRARRIEEIERALTDLRFPESEECAALLSKLRQHAQHITMLLWQLYHSQEQHELTERHILEELEKTAEKLGDLPPFQYDEARFIAMARYGVERLRAKLGEELHENNRRWLESKAETENQIAEVYKEYCDLLDKIETVSQVKAHCLGLTEILSFLYEDPPKEIIVLDGPEKVDEVPGVRLP